ncbi:MAG TPA: AI-2E family transporter [Vicinamibacterales bacterium]|jgi:predicted PurR-regulated permease PerM|nr:AI-2E family transporter [Vicinamibacterales bacterium]
MAENQRFSLRIPWATLLKIIAAVALVAVLVRIWYILTLIVIAIIVAVGLYPAVLWLERRRWSRSAAASVVVLTLLGLIVAFLAITWSSIMGQAQDVVQHLERTVRQLAAQLPEPVAKTLQRMSGPNTSTITAYALWVAQSVVAAVAAFLLASILVLYLLIEAAPTYQWVRGFVPTALRERFDRTACEARDVASAYIVANFVTSVLAFLYTFAWLALLGIPATLVLAVLAFVCDFVPVVGFFIACAPAVVMAATKSGALALAMIPIYGAYHFIENYLIGPKIYGGRLRLSTVAVLIAFAIGAELGGVVGALLAMPIAATYPTIEKLWLRDQLGDDVVAEHEAVRRKAS